MTKSTALIIVKAMLLPYLDYVLFVSTSCTNSSMSKLQRLVNRALRVVYLASRYTRLDDLYDRAFIMRNDLRARFNILKIMHYYAYSNHDNIGIIVPLRVTRATEAPVFKICQPLNTKYKNSLDYMGRFLWNSLPVWLRNVADAHLFKIQLKRFINQFRCGPSPPSFFVFILFLKNFSFS